VSDESLSFWERLGRIPAHSLRAQLLYISALVAVATVINLLLALVMRSWIPVATAVVGWLFVGVYGLVRLSLFDRAAGVAGSVLVPSGGSTPSVAQHSNIQALVARGEYAHAAEAYREVMARDPRDLLACEQLGQLALRELKDYPLALAAYREAEKRSTEPRRQLGYAVLVAGICRDNLKDYGKAMVELRRILARYPDAPNAQQLRAEIDELKALHFEAQ
jgi:tetratricopeptide (TPR) repeat protein